MTRSRHRRRSRAPLGATLLAALLALAVLAWGGSGTLSGWSAASLANPTNTALTGSMALTHSYNNGTTCSTTVQAATAACGPTLGTATSPPAAGSASASPDAITNRGDVAAAQAVTAASCAPVQLANAQQATDPMLPRNSVTFQQPDTWGTRSAATFSGSGYATDIVGTNGTGLLGLLSSNYSIGVWFEASDGQGGGLLSLASSLSNATSAMSSPALWLDGSRQVHFAVAGTFGLTVQGNSAAVSAGAWHLAVLTVSKGVLGLTSTATLYVDGSMATQKSGLNLLTGTSGSWHLGWADFSGLTAPASAYFHGSFAGAFVNQSTALAADDISTLDNAGSASAYRSDLAGQSGIASIWMLGDDGITTYAGALPGNEATPCAKVDITLTFSTPAATIGPISLATFSDGTSRSAETIAATQTQNLAITTTRGAGYASDIAGLHLYVPISFGYTVGASPGWSQTMTWSGDPTDVFWA